jgi:hypothetical protein
VPSTYQFDHLAIGVERWSDGLPRFAGEFGGRWSHGGDVGEYAPCQLIYRHGMKLELIAPGHLGDGFMRRFLDRGGPGAHHLTVKVPSLDATIEQVSGRGISILGGRMRAPAWQEAFLHPKQAGIGTLLQIVQSDEDVMAAMIGRQPEPAGFPEFQRDAATIAWIGLAVESAESSLELLTTVLRGQTLAAGPGWARLGWGTGHSLLIRDASATPGGPALWPDDALGVAHVVFGPADLDTGTLERGEARCERQPEDELTGVPVWAVR